MRLRPKLSSLKAGSHLGVKHEHKGKHGSRRLCTCEIIACISTRKIKAFLFLVLIALSVMPKNSTSDHLVPSVITCTASAYVASVNILMLVLA